MALSRTLMSLCGLVVAALAQPVLAQPAPAQPQAAAAPPIATATQTWFKGLPASDSLGADDIWLNPTFRGGVVNGGASAHSNW
ncbi:MAG TPA: hypothetical protein VGM25_14935 [Caulobacteraceae bacterium]